MAKEPLAVAAEVGNVFQRLNVRYIVTGSFASTIYGEFRATQDVDFVAAIREEHVAPLVASLSQEFWIDEEMVREALRRRGGSFTMVHNESSFTVDVHLPESSFCREELERGRTLTDEESGTSLRFATAEDVILAKLGWYKQPVGGSEKQWRDVVSILRVQQTLDDAYLDKWADWLHVAKLLAKARAEAKS